MSKILFIAGFPPPASGQLIMQKKMYDLIQPKDKKLISLNFSGSSKEFSKTSLKKIIKLGGIVFRIIREGLLSQAKIYKVYYSLSGPKKSALVKDIIIGIPLSIFFKKKLILQVHAGGYNSDFVESKFLFKCLQVLYRNIEHLLCLTEYQRRELRFLHAKTESIVYNFCDDIPIHAVPASSASKRLRLLSVGHLNANKGIDECVMLAGLLKEQGIEFEWKFIGSFVDAGFESKIRGMIDAFGIGDRIVINNEISNDLIFAEYAQADFLLFLSNGPEGQPVVLIEALMVAKAIIIAKDVCGIGEYIRSGYNGFLFDSYKDIVPTLAHYDAIDREGIRSNARKTYVDCFSVDNFSRKMSAIFEKNLLGTG